MNLLYSLAAAVCFASGGLYMKQSRGATQMLPTGLFLLLFIAGAILQARAMRYAEMGAVYVAVLGLEAVAALALSAAYLNGRLSWQRCAATALIIAGVILLKRE